MKFLKIFLYICYFTGSHSIVCCQKKEPSDENINEQLNNYTKFEENKMIIISVPKFEEELQNFISFKKSKGLDVELDISSALIGVDAVKNILINKFQNNGLTYIILVGDIEDVPSPYYLGAPSDPSYALLEGDDYIGDALVSRISVKSTLELKNIINKLIFYEKGNFINTEWISKAIVVGTHEFNGINHTSGIVNAMREQSGYFNKVIQILETDNNPHTTLMEAIENEGANMIVYNSHGSPDGFGSIVLNNSHISTLNTFGNSFPFIHGAGCSTGSFQWSEGDCFAEVILKTGTIEKPSGPVAMLAFSRSANPGPAMMAQRKAFKELFFIKEINTIGELCYFSNLYAMSQFDDYEAEKFYKHWHIFGDCSAPIWKSNE